MFKVVIQIINSSKPRKIICLQLCYYTIQDDSVDVPNI